MKSLIMLFVLRRLFLALPLTLAVNTLVLVEFFLSTLPPAPFFLCAPFSSTNRICSYNSRRLSSSSYKHNKNWHKYNKYCRRSTIYHKKGKKKRD